MAAGREVALSSTTLQINLTPADLAHATHTVPHQLRQLAGQVENVLLSVDLGATAPAGAFEADSRYGELRDWVAGLRERYPNVVMRQVDYGIETRQRVAHMLFGDASVPLHDYRGSPIHAVLEALLDAGTPWVLHLDSDMFIGGGSQTWVSEARRLLMSDSRCVLASPYPGPPRPDGRVLRQPDAEYTTPSPAVLIPNMSTRVFFMHVPSFVQKLAPLRVIRAPWKGRLWTIRVPNPPYQKLELVVTSRMNEQGLRRVDFLGQPPGLWSLHPPFRSEAFYARLPELVRRVEAGDLPDAQLGDFDLNDSVIDWTEARAARRREKARVLLLGQKSRALLLGGRPPD